MWSEQDEINKEKIRRIRGNEAAHDYEEMQKHPGSYIAKGVAKGVAKGSVKAGGKVIGSITSGGGGGSSKVKYSSLYDFIAVHAMLIVMVLLLDFTFEFQGNEKLIPFSLFTRACCFMIFLTVLLICLYLEYTR